MSDREVATPLAKAEIEQLVSNLESISEEAVVQFDVLTDRLGDVLRDEQPVETPEDEPGRSTVMGRRLQSVYRRLASLVDSLQSTKSRLEL